jgi:hypothetical protein
MQKQKTAVEFLVEQNRTYNFVSSTQQLNAINEAKILFKKQMIEFSKSCLDKALDLDVRSAYRNVEKYYEETFILQ